MGMFELGQKYAEQYPYAPAGDFIWEDYKPCVMSISALIVISGCLFRMPGMLLYIEASYIAATA